MVEVILAIDEFDCRLKNLDDIQSQIETDAEESSLGDIIEEAFSYRQRQLEVKIKGEILYQRLVQKKDDIVMSDVVNTNVESSHRSRSNFLGNARLPKLELPKFSGNFLEFNSFFDKFIAITEKMSFPPSPSSLICSPC